MQTVLCELIHCPLNVHCGNHNYCGQEVIKIDQNAMCSYIWKDGIQLRRVDSVAEPPAGPVILDADVRPVVETPENEENPTG